MSILLPNCDDDSVIIYSNKYKQNKCTIVTIIVRIFELSCILIDTDIWLNN